jgi:hypothetical protein
VRARYCELSDGYPIGHRCRRARDIHLTIHKVSVVTRGGGGQQIHQRLFCLERFHRCGTSLFVAANRKHVLLCRWVCITKSFAASVFEVSKHSLYTVNHRLRWMIVWEDWKEIDCVDSAAELQVPWFLSVRIQPSFMIIRTNQWCWYIPNASHKFTSKLSLNWYNTSDATTTYKMASYAGRHFVILRPASPCP